MFKRQHNYNNDINNDTAISCKCVYIHILFIMLLHFPDNSGLDSVSPHKTLSTGQNPMLPHSNSVFKCQFPHVYILFLSWVPHMGAL